MTDKLLSIQDVAERMQVHTKTVKLWIEQGKLEAVRISKKVTRITEEAFNRFTEGAK